MSQRGQRAVLQSLLLASSVSSCSKKIYRKAAKVAKGRKGRDGICVTAISIIQNSKFKIQNFSFVTLRFLLFKNLKEKNL